MHCQLELALGGLVVAQVVPESREIQITPTGSAGEVNAATAASVVASAEEATESQ